MHPEFLKIMDDTQAWLRYAFQTSNNLTLAVSGTGHAGMEAAVANIVEPGALYLLATRFLRLSPRPNLGWLRSPLEVPLPHAARGLRRRCDARQAPHRADVA